MKLEYVYDNNSNLKRIIFVSILIIVFCFSFWSCLGYLEYGDDIFDNMLYMLAGLTICLPLFLFYGVIPFTISFFVNKKKRKISNEIRKNGVKKVGYIYACYPTYNNYKTALYTSRYVFLVKVDYESYSIDWICDNKACMSVVRFLNDCDKKRTKLCNRFDYLAFRDFEKVYIDVYFYNGKVCADLDSVDMVKIKEKTDI